MKVPRHEVWNHFFRCKTIMKFKAGDQVVYQKGKVSAHPGPRAETIKPSAHGEEYSYAVDKYWLVTAVNADQSIDVITRTGKAHRIKKADPRLRRANFIERIFQADRFPDLKTIKEEP